MVFRFGVFMQAWINYQQSAAKVAGENGGYSVDMFLRRIRFFTFASFFKNFSIFLLFDSPNLGRGVAPVDATGAASKSFQPVVPSNNIMNDAFGEIKLADDAFMLEAGLMVKPFSHNGLQSTGNYIQLDISIPASLDAVTSTQVIRDLGFQLKGYVADDKLEYRIGAFQGLRQGPYGTNPISHNAPLIAGRLLYEIFDPEKGYVQSGHTYGRKKLLGVSAGFQWQKTDVDGADPFLAFSGAVFGAIPLSGEADPKNGGDELAFMGEFYRYDGGGVFGAALPKQNDVSAEVGYYNKEAKLSVFGRFEMRKVDSDDPLVKNTGNALWFGGGLKYYLAEGAANVTLAYLRSQFPDKIEAAVNDTNQFTVQLQLAYF